MLRDRPAWRELARHRAEFGQRTLGESFADDPGRGTTLTAEAAGLYLDYSKNLVTRETMGPLTRPAEESELPRRRNMMFRGEQVNTSEHRPALHVALRMPRDATVIVDGVSVDVRFAAIAA